MRTRLSDNSRESRLQRCAGGFVNSDLKAYLDKELSPIRSWFVGRHVSRCNACHEEVIWLQRLGKNMRLLEDAHPRPELRTRILSTLPPMETTSLPPVVNIPSRRVSAARYAFGGALCLLMLTCAFAALRGRSHAHSTLPAFVDNNTPAVHTKRSANERTTPNRTMDNHEVSPSIALPQDPTSKRANELYAQELIREKEEAARRLPDEWRQAIASVSASASLDKHGAPPYVQVAMEVKSVATAQKLLTDWASSANVTARVLPADESVHRNVAVLFTVSGSAASGTALLNQLKRVGEISALTSAGITLKPQLRVNPGVPLHPEPIPSSEIAAQDKNQNQNLISTNTSPIRASIPTIKPDTIKAPASGAVIVVVMLTPSIFNQN